jgi:ABC-type Zn uptake system ZnuABC Zn-binding protein ZnuA
MRLNRALALAVLLPVLAACASTASEQSASDAPASSAAASNPAADKPNVVAAFYPLQYAAQSVGGDLVNVTNLTQPGIEPHDLELSAQQVAQIAEADLVLYIKGFQPAVDEAIEQQAAGRAIDVSRAGLAASCGLTKAMTSRLGTRTRKGRLGTRAMGTACSILTCGSTR